MLSSRLGGTLLLARRSGAHKMCYVTLLGRPTTISQLDTLMAPADTSSSYSFRRRLPQQLPKKLTPTHRPYSHLKKPPSNLQVNTTAIRGKELLKDALELRKEQLLEKRDVFVKDMRETKSRVRERVKVKMEEIVERENVMTVPNLLCVGRAALSPYLAYVVVQQDYRVAMGVLMFAGLTDLVRIYTIFYLK